MRYLTAEEIVTINASVIKKYSPKEMIGIKEPASLDMTVHSPRQEVFGTELYPTLELKAANLYRNIAMKHIFHNANKRTAFLSMVYFLSVNGVDTDIDKKIAEDFTVKIVVDRLEEEEIAEWIKKHM